MTTFWRLTPVTGNFNAQPRHFSTCFETFLILRAIPSKNVGRGESLNKFSNPPLPPPHFSIPPSPAFLRFLSHLRKMLININVSPWIQWLNHWLCACWLWFCFLGAAMVDEINLAVAARRMSVAPLNRASNIQNRQMSWRSGSMFWPRTTLYDGRYSFGPHHAKTGLEVFVALVYNDTDCTKALCCLHRLHLLTMWRQWTYGLT